MGSGSADRERPVQRQPLYVAVTTCGREEDLQHSAETGIDLHLIKPVDPVVLIGVMRRFARIFG
jgi:hypothetical protein